MVAPGIPVSFTYDGHPFADLADGWPDPFVRELL